MTEKQSRAASLLREAANLLQEGASTSTQSPLTAPLTATSTSRSQLQAATRTLFSPYRSVRNSRKRPTSCELPITFWSHRFCALADCTQEIVPNREEKAKLFHAGLGEKKITFTKSPDANQFKQKLETIFPKIQDAGGFELLRSNAIQKHQLDLIQMPKTGYTAAYLADESCLNQAVCFIRPIQQNIPVDNCPSQDDTDDDDVEETCISCGTSVPVRRLRDHTKDCGFSMDTAESRKPAEAPAIHRRQTDRPICEFACVSNRKNECETTTNVQLPVPVQQCPVCSKEIPESDIQVHAATCGEDNELEVIQATDTLRSLDECLQSTISSEKQWDFSIVRSSLVTQTMDELEAASDNDWKNKVTVSFLGEEGVDAGGLAREFFTLLFKNTPVFEHGVLSHDSSLLRNKHYFLMGKMVATALCNGHPGPRCLSGHIVKFILAAEGVPVDEKSVPDLQRPDATSIIDEIKDLNTDATSLLSKYGDVLDAAGFHQVLTDKSRDDAVLAVKVHYQFNRFLPSLLQFIEGLKFNGILQILRDHPADASILLTLDSIEPALTVKEFFKPVYSADAVEKAKEATVMYNFHTYLKKLERGHVNAEWVNIEDGKSEIVTLNMDHLLQALIGCPRIPKGMYEGIITFDHLSKNITTVNTCAPSVNFSRIEHLQQADMFAETMIDIMIGAYGFGQK